MNAHKWFKRAVNALVMLMVLALVSMAAPPVVVHATTIRVINVDDIPDDFPASGCSLREAISLANAGFMGTANGCTVHQSGSGTPLTYRIILPDPKGGYTYTLTGAAGENGNASGDLDITASVTVIGHGAGSSIIDGGGIDRVFHVCPGAGGCPYSVLFTGVTIRSGSITGIGAGICNQGGIVTVDSSIVSDNAVSGVVAWGDGGGIYNVSGLMIVQDSTIVDNTATDDGGGIYNSGTLYVRNGSMVIDNEATDDGGGIYNEDGTVTVDDSRVDDNSAVDGGGIFSDDGTLTVQNGSIISFNEADRGGGIYNDWDSTATVDGSTIRSNDVALYGGGIHNLGGTLTVQNGSTIGGAGAGNMAQRGGGICNYGTATVDGSTVSGNTADSGGGIFHEADTFTVQNGSIIGGAGASNTATGSGGGIYILPGGIVIVNDSTVSANTANGGGGIYSRGTTIVNGGTISDNEASSGGGGVYNYEGTLTVSGGTVSGNSAISGGGIYNYEGLTTVMDSRVLNNTAIHGRGGGVLNRATLIDATNVTDSCIVGNSDTAFYNDEAAVQFAVGNWWGDASGPSGSGPGTGDSVSANVDYSDYLTEPILGCQRYVYLPLVLKH
jgi:CSLREA domain-containing protein